MARRPLGAHPVGWWCLAPLLPALLWAAPVRGQDDPEAVRRLVETLKSDRRGPFDAIRWFCPDGSVIPPQERCATPGGLQHGRYKQDVRALHGRGLYLGQLLAGQDPAAFWDEEGHHSRALQYVLEGFLKANDDGWIMRRGRYYRGAVQAEDEEEWSRRFLAWLVAQDDVVAKHFYLVRELAQALPRSGDAGLATRIRGLARTIAELDSEFMDLRVKIHGAPDGGDVTRVAAWRSARAGRLSDGVRVPLEELEAGLRQLYRSTAAERLERFRGALPQGNVRTLLLGLLDEPPPGDAESTARHVERLAELMWAARVRLQTAGTPAAERVALLDVSLVAEAVLMADSPSWRPTQLGGLLRKNRTLARAVAATGLLETWEWRELEDWLAPSPGATLSAEQLSAQARLARRAVEWAIGMIRAQWDEVLARYAAFEPLAPGIVDDRTRSSALLLLGASSALIADLAAENSGRVNSVLDLTFQSEVRGLNPGLARARLEVIDVGQEEPRFAPDRIYILPRPPAEMKPVAGIATVSEGNLVSHVQLLARNLGIPNAVFSPRALEELAIHEGKEVFYAVSPRGMVVMKPAEEMSEAEARALSPQGVLDERLRAPVERLDLETRRVLDLRALTAEDSGRLCGPKAANLGVLSHLFPEAVPPGLVIPFGAFAAHLEQPLPGGKGSYWDAVREVFAREGDEEAMRAGLAELRRSIREIPFLPGFREELEQRFRDWVGVELGEIAVFIRSDTNMEDLEGFTGAGLNLTVPNVRLPEEVLQGIRDVWASPFSGRSYQWRRRALENPADIYPSIVVLPSVHVDKSGVLITTGVASGEADDDTIAFNWGGTGAVGGQAAESWLLEASGHDALLSPAREQQYTRLLPGGGLQEIPVAFDQPILSMEERRQVRQVAELLRERLPGTRGLSTGPYDVELGFHDGKLWLFQVRRFVERGPGRATTYLMGLDDASRGARPAVPLDAPVRGGPQ